jgi:alkylation response protein AidB-like acyl-CoA dehydrogenase
MGFRSQARKYLKQLVEWTGETAELSARVKDQLILIEQVEGPEAVRLFSRVGSAYPYFHATAPAKIVKIFGTPEQQRKFLAPVVKGDWVSAMSLTEPNHGSDLTRMETSLREQADGFVLNGTKVFTTNGGYADFFVVLAQEDPEARSGAGMTTILVERDSSSWLGGKMEINEISGKMGLKMTSSSEIVFHDLKIAKENILGVRGRGLMNVLDFLDESRIEIGA